MGVLMRISSAAAAAAASFSSSFAVAVIILASSLHCINSIAADQNSYHCDDSFSFIQEGIGRSMTMCRKLRSLGAELGWRYGNVSNISSVAENVTVDIVFSATPYTDSGGGWIAWGLNPGKRPQMVGTRALVALLRANGTVEVHTYNVTAGTKRGCKLEPGAIEIKVDNLLANYSGETGALTMSASLTLNLSDYNITKLRHVWQLGSRVVNQSPRSHAMGLKNFDSFEIIDLTSGRGFSHTGLSKQRVSHGVLSVVGWGILLPTGVIVKRYSKVFAPDDHKQDDQNKQRQLRWWLFVLHVSVQLCAYTVGTTAWAIGLALMSNSKHFTSFRGHRTIGILIFCLATLQIMALCLKPKPKPSENTKGKLDRRKLWNIYHHFVGYSLIVLSTVNIFKGFAILQPPPVFKWIYVGVLAAIATVAAGLEISSWVQKHRQQQKDKNGTK